MQPTPATTAGVPVGAVVVPKGPLVGTVVASLRSCGWLKSGTNVTRIDERFPPFLEVAAASDNSSRKRAAPTSAEGSGGRRVGPQAPLMAVHVSPAGALAIQDAVDNNVSRSNRPLQISDHAAATAAAAAASETNPLAEQVLSLIIAGQARWISGLRVLSPSCRAGALASGGGRNSAATLARRGSKRVRTSQDDVRELVADSSAQTPPAPLRLEPRRPEAPGLRYVELFAGIGGFRVALDSLGGQCVFSSEISADVRETYLRNFGSGEDKEEDDVPDRDDEDDAPRVKGTVFGDITEVEADDIPDHEVLTAGFPCQSFCKVGDRTGLNDDRGQLFFEVIRILASKKPPAFLLENVANIVTMDEGATFEVILKYLAGAGYRVAHSIIDASAYVPQTRRRVYLVGFRDSVAFERFQWPEAPTPIPGRPAPAKSVRDILEFAADDATTGHLPDPPPHLILTASQLAAVLSSHTFQRGGDLSWRTAGLDGPARTLMGSYKAGFKMYSEFVPVCPLKDSPRDSPKGGAETAARLRFYSPRECARIMGFPDSFLLDERAGSVYHQV
ncbi:hypothetical protein HK405_004331 [Cladochytrium tenue]|nr:hypothetical protein HK405_004331 [Cladochytrium tenue]